MSWDVNPKILEGLAEAEKKAVDDFSIDANIRKLMADQARQRLIDERLQKERELKKKIEEARAEQITKEVPDLGIF